MVVKEIGLERTVAADHLQRAAREALTEREVDLRRAALARRVDRPAVVEHLAGIELARAEQARVRALHASDERVHLAHGMDGLLEHDVARRAEHPVREVA